MTPGHELVDPFGTEGGRGRGGEGGDERVACYRGEGGELGGGICGKEGRERKIRG